MRYILIRHGQSIQNIGEGAGIIDYHVKLSAKGIAQSEWSACIISDYIKQYENISCAVVYSPYARTRFMAECLKKKIKAADYYEEALISEIQCGEYEGYIPEQYKNVDKLEFEKMMKHKEEKSRFWYRYKNGESPFDVNVRANCFLQKSKYANYDLIVVISHLFFLKTLEMNLLNRDIEWFENASNYRNAEIHIISNYELEKVILPE